MFQGTFLSKKSKSQETVNGNVRNSSVDSNMSGTAQLFTKIGSFRGKLLAIKHVNKPYVAVTKMLIKEINEVINRGYLFQSV